MASEEVGIISHDDALQPANEEDLPERSVSAEPLVSSKTTASKTEGETKSSPTRPNKGIDEIPMEVARKLRNVLNTRPSVRMASRHQLAPLHQDSFSRENPIRHTLPVRTSVEVKNDTLADIRRKQLQKTSFLSSFNLGEGLPLQKMDNSVTISNSATTASVKAFPLAASSTPTQSISSLGKTEMKVADIDSPVVGESTIRGSGQEDDDEVPNIVVQDLEQQKSLASNSVPMDSITAAGDEAPVRTLERASELQKSTRHLKQRMLQHRQTLDQLDKQHIIEAGCLADWQYVKWPKIKSWLSVQLSRRLWKSHLKEVEGHFGTAVVSYFIFLRWLFVMNLLIFMLWFSFICIPEIVYVTSRVFNSTSQASCVFQIPSTNNNSCSSTSTSSLVFSLQSSNCSYTESPFSIQTCSFNDNGVADRESGSVITVVSQLYDSNCVEVNPDEATVPNITSYTLCPNVNPHYIWYIYITDFISGTGIFNETLLFHGIYPNTSIGEYRFDIAFLVMIGIIYVVSMILLIYKMGHAFNESYVEFGKKRKVNFCNKLFTAWDFNITNSKTADLKKVHIKTDFQEELADINAREQERTRKELAIVILIRICTNTFVIISLVGAGAAIYFSAQFELLVASGDRETIPIIGEYLSSIIISVLNAVYPFVFTLVAKIEKYQTAGESVIITLLRTILVRLSSLLVLLASLYQVISGCTRVVDDEESSSEECTFATVTGNIISFNDSITDDESCPVCWETFIGQQFFRLALTNLLVSLGATISIETGRNFAAYSVKKIDFRSKRINNLLTKVVKRGNFNISKSILDLIYTQSLLWLGFLFSPLLPSIILLTSFCLFYVKKYSLIYNLEPDKKGFARSAQTSFMFLLLMLLALFASAIPVLYAVTTLKPSENCGPFRGQDTMYQSITLLVDRWSCTLQIIVDFFTSAAFVVPLLIFLLLVVYALYVMLKARDDRFDLIKKQLVLEGANVTHIVGHLDTVLLQLVGETSNSKMDSEKLKRFPSQNTNYIEDLYKRYSKATPEINRSTAILDTTTTRL